MAPPASSNLRERTSEFLAVVERLQKQQGLVPGSSGVTNGDASAAQRCKSPAQQQSEFARVASQIGLGIHKTSLKLQKLAQLAKRTSMFDDPQREIDELTGIIKQDIQQLNASIAELQDLSIRRENSTKQSSDHSHTVVDSLRSRLKDTTQEFKEVLTTRTESLKTHKNRRQLYSSTPETTPLLGGRQAGNQKTASSLFGADGSFGSQQQQQLAVQQDTYVSSRAEALHNVEATIVELGSIFQQLATMVAEQGEMAERIDANVEETLVNVDNAKAQLLKYLNTISSNRWLVMKVFGVLTMFLIIFIVFIA